MPSRQLSPDPISTRAMLSDLLSTPRALGKLKGAGQEYGVLLDFLLVQATNKQVPTAKAMQQHCGIKSPEMRQWLEALYQDFLAALASRVDFIDFGAVEYCLVVAGRRDDLTIRCRLPECPQIGEGMDLEFVSAAAGGGSYFVDRIDSEYTEGKITRYVYLKPGYYDPYQWQLRARARFEGKLPSAIEREMGEDELAAYLRQTYAPPVAASPPVPPPYPGPDIRRPRR